MSSTVMLSWQEYAAMVAERARLRRQIAECQRVGALRVARQIGGRLGIVEGILRTADEEYRRAAEANAEE